MSGERRFGGQWVGATQGYPMPAHIWEIVQQGLRLRVTTRWEGGPLARPFDGQLLPDGSGFTLGPRFRAIALGPQHFVVPGWDTSDARGGVGPDYDVVFARPGIAELAAPAIYARFMKAAGGA